MSEISSREKQKVARRWDKVIKESRLHFYTFGPTKDYVLQCLSGDRNAKADRPDWLEDWLVRTFLGERIPVDECLSLCSTAGMRERHLAGLGVFKHCTGIDISEQAVGQARENARKAGYDNIDYIAADLDYFELGREKYDIVFALGALHHISRLEHLITEIHRALRPGGLLIDHDYVGPNYGDLSVRHREIINAAMHLIPHRLRVSTERTFCPAAFSYPRWRRAFYEAFRLLTFRPSTINFTDHPVNPNWPMALKWAYGAAVRLSRFYAGTTPRRFRFGKVFDTSPMAVRKFDPSEGIRASEIIPIIKSVFGDVTVRYANASVLHYALDQGFFRNYRPDSSQDRAVLDMLIHVEKVMTDLGEIPPILATCVARKAQ
jgi:SAM-dependent methyltransferase